METAVTVKGQVVIPAKIRHRLGIKKGTKLFFEERKGEIILRPLDSVLSVSLHEIRS